MSSALRTVTGAISYCPASVMMMFNVNGWGAYSTGLGYKMPGGELCTTHGFTNKVGCFLPNGTMILQSTGPGRPTGPVETLTAPMIESLAWLISKIPWLRKLIKAHPSW